jgi:hypothetical protein
LHIKKQYLQPNLPSALSKNVAIIAIIANSSDVRAE